MTAPPIVATHVYRALVYLYPPAFRRQFASEMTSDFRDATCEAWYDGGWLAYLDERATARVTERRSDRATGRFRPREREGRCLEAWDVEERDVEPRVEQDRDGTLGPALGQDADRARAHVDCGDAHG